MTNIAKRQGLDYGLFERVEEARKWLESVRPAPCRLRIVGDDDPDGTTSGFVLARALQRLGYETDLKIMSVLQTRDVDVGLSGNHAGALIADAGSGLIEYIDSHGVPTLILDHHRVKDYEPRNVFEVNPRRVGGEHTDHVSASVVCQVFAQALDPENRATAFAAVAGGIADKQHLGGFKGLLAYCIDEAVAAGHLERRDGLTLPGRNVRDAIVLSLDPYFDGLTGEPEATTEFLKGLGVDPKAAPTALADDEARAVAAALSKRLEAKGVVVERVFPLYGETLPLTHPSGVTSAFALTQMLETLTAEDDFVRSLRILHGDEKAAKKAESAVRARVEGILKELARMKNIVEEHPSFRIAHTKDGANTGTYAHILLTYVYGDDKPFLVASQGGSEYKFSARGSPNLYGAGVDLSIGMHEAATSVGGRGGGHPGASGAAIPEGELPRFLKALDGSLTRLRRPE